MTRSLSHRFRRSSSLERAVYAVLVLVLVIDVALIAFGRADGSVPGPVPTTGTSASAPSSQPADPVADAGDAGPPCADVTPPTGAGDPVTCRARTATLTIAGAERPVILGATQVRLLRSSLRGRVLSADVRVRNETDSAQSLLAGGQEIYLNLRGVRVDAKPVGDLVVQPMEGRTVTLNFALTTAGLERLTRVAGQAEMGVKPWTEAGEAPARVGVIRFTVPVTGRAR
ncbi:MAG TPA: hypothetical protein VF549_18145 [Solirubrobacteraceae bacterium]|jgi:hypothetical protein